MNIFLSGAHGWWMHLNLPFPTAVKVDLPEFPLIPASKGFCITLHKTLQQFKSILECVGVTFGSLPDAAEEKATPLPCESQQATAVSPSLTEPKSLASHNS